MDKQTKINDSLLELRRAPVQKIPLKVYNTAIQEESDLHKRFFSGKISFEEYLKKKKVLHMI